MRRDEVFIPKRLYERMKAIYNKKLTIITAPDGSGKTTLTYEFIARTRSSDFACKSFRGKTADECFMRLSEYVTGKPEHIPLTDSELVRLKEIFSAAKPPEKNTLLIFDAPAAAEMLLTCLRCAELLKSSLPYSLLILTDREYSGDEEISRHYDIEHIYENELAFTEYELAQYLKMCGVDYLSASEIYRLTHGRIQHIRLCILAARAGESCSETPAGLFYHGLMNALTPEQRCGIMIAVTFDRISPRFCRELSQTVSVSAGLDPSCFETDAIIDNVKLVGKMTGAIHINRHTLEVSFNRVVRLAVKRHFDSLPFEQQRGWRICIANEYLRCGENFFAFCELFLAEEWEQAANVRTLESMSLDTLLAAKELLFRFVTTCPLDCKPIIPRLLRVTALLMLTSKKDSLRGKFAEITAYLQTSQDYTERERRQILSYAYLMRTYEHFYELGTMGNTIKTAYDLFSTAIQRGELFHSWTMYSPSVFCMIHKYSTPVKIEREQFTRYMKMYVEMAGHGYYTAELFNAESILFEGKPEAARSLFERIVNEAQDITPLLEALFMSAISCMCLGLYEPYARHLRRIIEITHRRMGTEEGDMGLLCFALLGWLRGGSVMDMWHLAGIDSQRVRTNRYSEPFVYLITCKLIMRRLGYKELVDKITQFRNAAQAVSNEVLAVCFTLYEAEVHRLYGCEEKSAELLSAALETTHRKGTDFFPAMFSVHYPELFRLAQALPYSEAAYAEEIVERGKKFRMGIEAVRSYELSVTGGDNLHSIKDTILLKRACAACRDKRLDISDRAYKYAVLASVGLSNAEIANICSVTEDSVKSSLKRTFAKAGIRSRSQLKTIIPPIK
ncbi:MAG: hypothetical protein ACI4KM_03980 [Oscillospiraceae bacterium]